MPDVRNVLGTSPSPANVNFGNLLFHFPDGTSGSEFIQSCNASKSATEIRPSRKRSTRCFMKYGGGGFLIFGILILPMKYDPLQFRSQAAEFKFVLGFLDALQAQMQGLLGGIGCDGRGPIGLRPSRLNGFACACTALFRSEFRGSGGAALRAAFAPKGHRGWVFPLCVYGHTHIVRERSRVTQIRKRSRKTK